MWLVWRSVTGAAALVLSVGAVQAATVNISGAGLFNAPTSNDPGAPATSVSAPGQSFAFSFITPDPIPGNPDGTIINPMFTLGAMAVAPTITSVTFSDATKDGLFDLNFSDGNVLSFYGAAIDDGGYLQSGSYLASVALSDDTRLAGDGFVAVSVNVSPVPLPASAPMFGAALLGLGALGYAYKQMTRVRLPA